MFYIIVTIGGNLFIRHSKNLIHAHKDSNDILSVIIILRTYVCGEETVFKMECLWIIL